MKIISWNTNGLRATAKQGNFEPLFKKYKPDIVCLQETKAEANQLPEEVRNYPGYYSYFSHSKTKKGYSGVAIYSKVKPERVTEFDIPRFDEEGRTLVAYYKDFVLINCYFPNGGGPEARLKYKLDFYDAFLEFVERLQNPPSRKASGGQEKKYKVIFCGDVNVAHEEIDLARPKENETHVGFLPVERAWVDEVIAQGWVDVFRHFYPTKAGAYTYWDQKSRARDRNVGWRIDYFFVSPTVIKDVKSTSILADYPGSDHCPILLDLQL